MPTSFGLTAPSLGPIIIPLSHLGKQEEGSVNQLSPSFPGAALDALLDSVPGVSTHNSGSCRFVGCLRNHLSSLGIHNEELSASWEGPYPGLPSWCVLGIPCPCWECLAHAGGLIPVWQQAEGRAVPAGQPSGCSMGLAQELLVTMVGKQLISNVQEVAMP